MTKKQINQIITDGTLIDNCLNDDSTKVIETREFDGKRYTVTYPILEDADLTTGDWSNVADWDKAEIVID